MANGLHEIYVHDLQDRCTIFEHSVYLLLLESRIQPPTPRVLINRLGDELIIQPVLYVTLYFWQYERIVT